VAVTSPPYPAPGRATALGDPATSTMPVMDKSTKSSGRVKYPTEKGRPRDGALHFLISPGRLMSGSVGSLAGKMDVWKPYPTGM
jgi:hypothetical protein